MIVYEHSFPVSVILLALLAALLAGGLSAWRYLPRRALNAFLFALYVVILLGVGWCLLLPGHKDSVTQLIEPKRVGQP